MAKNRIRERELLVQQPDTVIVRKDYGQIRKEMPADGELCLLYRHMKDTIQKNSVSIAGEFAVLSQLTLRGFDANMTLGNTKNVDIIVSNPTSGNMFKIEVKTTYSNKPSHSKLFGYTMSWIMSEKHETIIDPKLFYCFVNIEKETNIFRFFIVPSKVVSEYVKNQHIYWLKSREVKMDNSLIPMRQFRIGLDDKEDYLISTPLAKDYENKWIFE